ncbi:MAG: sugar phosphate isomerase/epimerase [Defluviitaleaceae bacterium]|nr:sugar phosphate isomerase/epimerase [Defluviitaleaceae bacterium]
MKIGISSYSYFALLQDGTMTLKDVISHAAKTGYDQIEFIDITPPEGTDIIEYAEALRAHADENGIEISAYTVGAEFMLPNKGTSADEVTRVKTCLDVAAVLGAKMLRHDATWGFKGKQGSYIEAIDVISPYIREVAEYGQGLGIKTMCENHGFFMQDSYRMEYLVQKVNHSNFGILIDIGNFLCADENPISAVARLAPYATHVHVKDFLVKTGAGPSPGDGWFQSRGGEHLRGTVIGHGVVPVPQCLKILRDNGYTGDVSMEFEGLENSLFASKAGHKLLKSLV